MDEPRKVLDTLVECGTIEKYRLYRIPHSDSTVEARYGAKQILELVFPDGNSLEIVTEFSQGSEIRQSWTAYV